MHSIYSTTTTTSASASASSSHTVPEMAYAALHSLLHTIKGLPESSSTSLRSALHHACSLQSTLEECSEGVGDMDEHIIIEAARNLEDAIEFPLLSQPPTSSFNLDDDVDCFVRTAKERKEITEGLWEQKAVKMIEEDIEELFVQKPFKPDQEEEEEDVEMVGLCDQFFQIRDYLLTERGGHRVMDGGKRVIWISGMAGIGKTLLAKKIFDDPLVKKNFQYQAFVRVGQKCQSQEKLLQAIMDQGNLDTQTLRTTLTVTRSLIVLDDVWKETLILPLLQETHTIQGDKGSLILVTSRSDSYYFYYFWNLKMRFMDEEESWELLKRKVFGEEEECPPQLVKAGKKIAEKCEGLPLLINAVAPILLSKAQKNLECWKRVAEKPNSVLEEASYQISDILFTSYHYLLNEEAKLGFLFVVAFPQNCIVRISKINNLCCAERFDYSRAYNALIRHNLMIGHQKSWSRDESKACCLHCAYWYPSKRIAENNRFLYILNSCADDLEDSVKSHRRLASYSNALLAIKEVREAITSVSTMRSLLCTGPYHQYQVPISWEWKLLRVLHALTIRFYEFPVEVVKLVRLRYLSLTCNANLPRSISKLRNLEFLIVHQHLSIKRVAVESYLPVEMWDLQELKHLEIVGRNLPHPPRPGVVLPNLIKLLDVGAQSCTKGVLESLPKLKKLRIQIELAPHAPQTSSYFDHISCFHEIEFSFQCVIMNPTLLRPSPSLSISTSSLKKLSFNGFGYPWEDMSKIAELLPRLYVLKLQSYAFRGEKWEAKEMRFPNLNYLLIEDTDLVQWTAGDETFPRLRKLTMKNCHKLREVPPRLRLYESMELVDCNPIAEIHAKKSYDAEGVTISAKYSWKKKEKLK